MIVVCRIDRGITTLWTMLGKSMFFVDYQRMDSVCMEISLRSTRHFDVRRALFFTLVPVIAHQYCNAPDKDGFLEFETPVARSGRWGLVGVRMQPANARLMQWTCSMLFASPALMPPTLARKP